MAQAAASFSKKIEGFFGLFLEFWESSPRREEAGQLWIGMRVQLKDSVVEIVEQGIRNGEFEPVDAEQLVWAMMAVYDGLAAYAMMIPDIDIDRASQVFVETLLKGLETEKGGRECKS